MTIVGHLAVREDVGLSPACVRLLHAFDRADRREDVLRVPGLDRHEDVRTSGHTFPFAGCRTRGAPTVVEDECNAALRGYHEGVARVLLVGPPGSGKTTIATRVVSLLRDRDEPLGGFTTKEIRRGGRRTGFVVTGVHGVERTLAVRGGSGPLVGGYSVDVDAFEEVALLEIESGLDLGHTLVVDEIGKMELLSERFVRLIGAIFGAPRLLATVQSAHHAVTDALKVRSDVEVVHLPVADRDELPRSLAAAVLRESVRPTR
jgi:nucleoside-triphosphatase